MSIETKYPECERMAKVKDKSQAIGSFLDWLQKEERVSLMIPITEEERKEYVEELDGAIGKAVGSLTLPEHKRYPLRIEELLAKYFDIDLGKVEEERRQILEEHRKMNEEE